MDFNKLSVKKPIAALNTIKTYFRSTTFGSAFMLVICDIFNVKRRLRVKIDGQAIEVRTASRDFSVAVSCLLFKEFEEIEYNDPLLIIDAGGHIGAASMYFAKRFPYATIICLEIEHENFEILTKNVAHFPNVKPIHKGLWHTETEIEIRNRYTGNWGYTLCDTTNENLKTGQVVECITINKLIDEFGFQQVDILKLDVEGAEKEILRNSSAWINNVNVLVVELHDRITPGCTEEFEESTREFRRIKSKGEKVIAYAN